MTEEFDLVIGLGMTGQSCVRYLTAQGMPLRALDTRAQPPGIDALRADFPQLPVHLGGWRDDWLSAARRLVVSPGIALSTPALAMQAVAGKEIIGDIELFARAVNAPVAAITGSNAKSTVTSMLGEVAHACGRRTLAGGNLGTPALDLLSTDTQLYVMELSSFQLETTYSLAAQVACVLNLSQDHLDRYSSLSEYIAAKQRIYDGCQVAVWNADDAVTQPQHPVPEQISFGTSTAADYRLDVERGVLLARGRELLPVGDLTMRGHHNALNVLAVLAMAEALSLPMDNALSAAAAFRGLPHRCELVTEVNGVQWFNDSKATNAGAALAALKGIAPAISGRVILIAGGQAKGQDFSELAREAGEQLAAVILIGEATEQLEQAFAAKPTHRETDMAAAVRRAAQLAESGDAVLLSPACASFDMYSGYVARGEDFVRQVREVCDAG